MPETIKRPAPKHLMIGPVRVAWPHLFKPRTSSFNGVSRTRFEATILVPKSSDKIIAALRADIKATWVAKFGEKPLPVDKQPLRDGDKPTTDDESDRGKHPGHVYFNVSARQDAAPTLINGDRSLILDPFAIESGDWVNVMVNPYAYTVPDGGGAGVSLSVVAVQFIRKGDPIGAMRLDSDMAKEFFADVPASDTADTEAF